MQPHAAIERIDREGEREPSLDQTVDVGVARMEVEHSARALGQLGTDRQAGDMRGFEGIDHVEIVCPGLGKILPGVRACIGGDKTLRPIGRRAARIVVLQGRGIILSLIAEDAAELIQVRRAEDQPAPVIVPILCRKWPSKVR